MKKSRTQGLVYSTDTGRICPGCGHPVKQCGCSKKAPVQTADGVVRVKRQTKGRKGSGVSLIEGLPLNETDLKKLGKELKKKCGSGGTVKNGIIEIQGDHRDILVKSLIQRGYNAKMAGG